MPFFFLQRPFPYFLFSSRNTRKDFQLRWFQHCRSDRRPRISWTFENTDGLNIVIFLEHDLYDLGVPCRNDLSYKIGLERQLTVFAATIDSDSRLSPGGT